MDDMYWAGRYKEKIINLVLGIEDTITLINPEENEFLDQDDVLRGGTFYIDINDDGVKEQVIAQGNVFDFYYVPSTVVQSKSFICVETEVDNIDDDMITEFVMYIYVFTSKDNVRLSGYSIPTKTEMVEKGYAGNRIDMLCSSIDKNLRGRSDYGIGKVTRAKSGYSKLSAPTVDYYGKRTKYTVKNYTDNEGDNCGIQ